MRIQEDATLEPTNDPGQNLQLKEGKKRREKYIAKYVSGVSNIQQYVSGVCILLTEIY
jgi:hypothetical protein